MRCATVSEHCSGWKPKPTTGRGGGSCVLLAEALQILNWPAQNKGDTCPDCEEIQTVTYKDLVTTRLVKWEQSRDDLVMGCLSETI